MDDQTRSQPEPNDELLVARVAQRDVTALALLYDRYARPVYVLAAHMLGSTDAEEIVQEVFLRLWDRAGQFDAGRGAFKPWFMTIARYRVLDELRRRGQRRQVIVAADVDQVLANAADPGMNVEQEVGLREDGRAVLRALQALPAEQRRVLILAYFGGLSQASIAQHLGAPLGTVKKRIRLGLQKLRISLAPQWLAVDRQEGPAARDAKVRNEL